MRNFILATACVALASAAHAGPAVFVDGKPLPAAEVNAMVAQTASLTQKSMRNAGMNATDKMVEIAVKSLGTCAFSTKTGESLNSTLLRCGEKRGFVKAETLTEATNVAAGTCTEATNTITLLDRMTGWNAVMASTCNNGVTAVKITAKLGTDLSTN